MKRIFASLLICTQLAADPTIPVLDMHAYHNPQTREAFITDLFDACQTVGFFALTNTDINLNILDEAYAAIAQFFHQDRETKMRYSGAATGGQRGYSPGESAKGEDRWDVKEFNHIGRQGPDEFFQNIWPTEMNLKGPFLALFDEMERCVGSLEEALSLAMGQDPSFVTRLTGGGETLVRALRYPPNPPKEAIWAGEHTDISYYTVIPRTTAQGLQVMNTEGEWITVVVPDDAFIINVGDKLQNQTNGLFRSGLHRVVDLGRRRAALPQCHLPRATRREASRAWPHLAQSGFLERMIKLGIESPEAMQAVADAGLASPLILARLVLPEHNPLLNSKRA